MHIEKKTQDISPASRNNFLRPMGMAVAMAALLFAVDAGAQTTPNSNTDNTRSGSTMDAPPPARPADRATDTPTQQNRAWQRFDDRTTTDLELDDTQRQRLRDIDERYDREYRALGTDPMTNPAYDDLYMRRDNEVRGVLTEDQYERWNRGNTDTTKPLRDTNTGTAPTPER